MLLLMTLLRYLKVLRCQIFTKNGTINQAAEILSPRLSDAAKPSQESFMVVPLEVAATIS